MAEMGMLAALMRQAEGEGLDFATLRALVEEASEAGAGRALGRLGLDGPQAQRDMEELRQLLEAWRDAKKSVRNAVLGWLVRAMLAGLLIAMAVKLGLADLLP